MKDHGDILSCRRAILTRQKISFDYPKARACLTMGSHRPESGHFTRRPSKGAHVAESVIEQHLDESRSNETGGAGDEDWIVRPDDEVVALEPADHFGTNQ